MRALTMSTMARWETAYRLWDVSHLSVMAMMNVVREGRVFRDRVRNVLCPRTVEVEGSVIMDSVGILAATTQTARRLIQAINVNTECACAREANAKWIYSMATHS